MAKRYRINDSFEMIGAFWPYWNSDAKFTGTLSALKGKVILKTSPTYRQLDESSVRDGMNAMNANLPLVAAPAICGFTSDNRCTLLAAYKFDNGGLTNYPTMEEVQSKRYESSRTVMGLHVESADAQVINSAAVYLTKVQFLMPTPWRSQFEINKTSYEAPTECLEAFRLLSLALDAEISCEVFAGGGWKMGKGTRLTSVPRIKISPRTPQSVDWFTSLAFRLENFFTLFLGTSAETKHIQLFQGEDVGWVMQKVRSVPEKINIQLWIKCPFQMTSDALAKWLAVPKDERPVELTLLGMLRKSNVFDETRFLSLAQALEGFGRIRFPAANRRKVAFKEYIEKSYDLLSPAFALDLLGDRSSFVKKVVQTRNYYTHLGIRKGAAATQTNKELFLLNHRLNAFLRCLILVDLSVAEDYLREPILYQATRWR